MNLLKPTFILFILALILIINNLTGIFVSLRNEDIFKENFSNKFGISLTEKQFYAELEMIFESEQSDSSKAVNTSFLVNKSLAHYWRDEGIIKYNLRIPFYENYLLWSLSYINKKEYAKHEFLNWKKAIERGVGLCSQHAIIVSEILNKNGINSKMIGLSGHVIATAEVKDNKWIILDPDYGVNVPFDIKEIEDNPGIIEPFYAAEGYDTPRIDVLKRIFGKEGNRLVKNAKVYCGKSGRTEKFSYWLIWIIPAILIIPFMIQFKGRKIHWNHLK
jgi:hypothetical protein